MEPSRTNPSAKPASPPGCAFCLLLLLASLPAPKSSAQSPSSAQSRYLERTIEDKHTIPNERTIALVIAAEVIGPPLPNAPSSLLQQEALQPTQAPPPLAQPPPAQPPQETEAERKAREHAQADRELKVEETQRIAAVVPNFNTVITGQAAPLSKGQKISLAAHSTFDPFNAVGAVVLAGFSEIAGSNRGFGWGPGGYFKRVGANAADIVVGTMLAGAAYPILFRQDPRFFRQGSGTIRARARHAFLGAFICRGDNGRSQPNFSNVLGNFSAGLISNLYYPSNETGIGLSLTNSSVVTAEGALGNIALEFAPDIQAHFHRKKSLPHP